MPSEAVEEPAWKRRIWRAAPFVLAAVLPAVLLGIGVARLILNQFFDHAPYLLDAGWYSKLIWHAGFSPRNPRIACDYAEWYFGVHPSLYISLWSGLSYLVPVPRIEWYALFQACVFAPFGFAVYTVSSRLDPAGTRRRLWVTVLAAFAFTFHGQVLRMIEYPHYEPAIPAFGCLALGMIVTGRVRLAWLFLAITLSVREDAGVHIGLAMLPLLYLHWRGVELRVTRRTLLAMIGTAFAATVAGMICQKLLSNGFSTMKVVYLGDPIYAHVSGSMLVERAGQFLRVCPGLYYPLLATCVLAILRRDARYLLGYAAGVPWFVLNFLAIQPQKATFESYAHFPYIMALFWVFAYGALLAPPARRLRPAVLEGVFALVCVSSTLGLYHSQPAGVAVTVRDMTVMGHVDRASVHGFVNALGEHHSELGRLYVDYGVAAIALESVRDDELWNPDVKDADTVAFHGDSIYRDQLLPALFANHLDDCVWMRGTNIYVCAHTRVPADVFAGLRTGAVPSLFTFANSLHRPGVHVDERGVTYRNGVGIDAWLGRLPKGRYELKWTIDTSMPSSANPMVEVQILSESGVRTAVTALTGATELTLDFDVSGDEELIMRSQSRVDGAFTVTGASVRQIR